jgi:hypothetical protein
MRKGSKVTSDRILHVIVVIVSGTAVIELALSQFFIKMTRLSAVEITGMAIFVFIIFGLITLFAVTRIENTLQGKFFAAIMNIITAASAVWYLNLLLHDGIFFRNIYYLMNRQTGVYELLPLSKRITASMPLVCIIAGTAVYLFSGAVILLTMVGSKNNTKAGRKKHES